MPDKTKKIEEDSSIHNEQLKKLVDTSSAMNKSLDLDVEAVLETVSELASKLFNVGEVSVVLLNPTTRETVDRPEEPLQKYSSDEKNYLVVPLKVGENIIGVLNFDKSRTQLFTSD